jgi:Fungal tRNA ligase phosphodiesterase domain
MSKILYLGIFLTEDSVKKLYATFPPIFPKLPPDPHVTLSFKPDEGTVSTFRLLVGKKLFIEVKGYALDAKAEAVIVSIPPLASQNKIPHITLSTAEGVPPVYSNTLLGEARAEGRKVFFMGPQILRYEAMEPFALECEYDVFPRSKKD